MERNGRQMQHAPKQERRPPNRDPEVSRHRLASKNQNFSLLRETANRGETFRPVPRDLVRAFLDQPTSSAPRFVILLPVEASSLWDAMDLAVVLGQSLAHMPELRARDELVLDVAAGTYHHVFCDLGSAGGIECVRPCGHDGPCATL